MPDKINSIEDLEELRAAAAAQGTSVTNYNEWYQIMQQLEELGVESTGSYAGTGKYGSNNKNNAYVGFRPQLFLVYSTYSYPELGVFKCEAMTDTDKTGMFMDVSTSNDITGNSARFITDSGGGVRWWSSSNEERQFNASGRTYYYFALRLEVKQ